MIPSEQIRARTAQLRSAIWLTAIVVMTVVVYGQSLPADFVNFDDDAHVYANSYVFNGLTLRGIVWDFGIHGPSQWHPLAWLSHQLDATVFGAEMGDGSASGHHLVNLLLHVLNVLLVYRVFNAILGSEPASVFGAAVFAVHPLNVESVAWISERRNGLCLCFLLLAILAHLRYVRGGGSRLAYGWICILHAAALMSKPMAVTLPCLLWLLDVWPLRRFEMTLTPAPVRMGGLSLWMSAVLEKIPLLVLSGVSCFLTVRCQQVAGVVSSLDSIPLSLRLANSVLAYGDYLRDFVWPVRLCVLYMHPAVLPNGDQAAVFAGGAFALILILVITAAAWRCRAAAPWVLLGWLWYLGTLVPMIGLVQVGIQQRADRYMYLPMLGLLLAIAGCIPKLWNASACRVRPWLLTTGIAIILALAVRAADQVGCWRNSEALFRQALAVEPKNHCAHLNLGQALQERGDLSGAARHYAEALLLSPDYALAHYNLGVLEFELKNIQKAGYHFDRAVRLDARNTEAWVRRGALLAMSGQLEQAERDFREAGRLDPEQADAPYNLGLLQEHRGQREQAAESFREALRRDPKFHRAADAIHRLDGSVTGP